MYAIRSYYDIVEEEVREEISATFLKDAPFCRVSSITGQGIPELQVRAAVRSTATRLPAGVEVVATGDLDKVTDWRAIVADVDVVVHAAARVHVMGDSGTRNNFV